MMQIFRNSKLNQWRTKLWVIKLCSLQGMQPDAINLQFRRAYETHFLWCGGWLIIGFAWIYHGLAYYMFVSLPRVGLPGCLIPGFPHVPLVIVLSRPFLGLACCWSGWRRLRWRGCSEMWGWDAGRMSWPKWIKLHRLLVSCRLKTKMEPEKLQTSVSMITVTGW
jgi:hypothetical protein